MSSTSSNIADSLVNEDFINLIIGEDTEEEKWRNVKGQLNLINQLVSKGETPISILKNYFGVNVSHAPEDPVDLWSIILHLITEGTPRNRIDSINTFSQALNLIKDKKNIMVLTGAGISVPCGVPDFRSRNGIYARLAIDYPDLDDPHSMFDISYFVKNPRPFFKFAKEIYPGNFEPSLGHKFIKVLEDNNKLLRNYSQNIDTIEMIAGISKIIQCHGSFSTATCMRCEHKVSCDVIKEKIMANIVPICTNCTDENERDLETILNNMNISEDISSDNSLISFKHLLPIIKPDIVFFGEGLPKDFHSTLAEDKDKADLLIVIGSSLKVRPVAHIPNCLPSNVPQILINKEPLSNHRFDVELYGDCDVIVQEICRQLGWLNQLGIDDDMINSETGEKDIEDMKADIENLTTDTTINDGHVEEIKHNCDVTENAYDINKQDNDNDDKNCNGETEQICSDMKNIEEICNDNDSLKHYCEDNVSDGIAKNGDQCSLNNIEYSVEEPSKYLLVSDLISEKTRVIRVKPNRYVFKGAELHVKIDNLQDTHVVNMSDSEDDDISSSTENSGEFDDDEEECDNKESTDETKRGNNCTDEREEFNGEKYISNGELKRFYDRADNDISELCAKRIKHCSGDNIVDHILDNSAVSNK